MLDLISKSDVLDPSVFDDSDPEQARVQSILDAVLGHLSDDEKILYHFGECEGHDDEHYKFVMSDTLKYPFLLSMVSVHSVLKNIARMLGIS